jgi:hypothetical protein
MNECQAAVTALSTGPIQVGPQAVGTPGAFTPAPGPPGAQQPMFPHPAAGAQFSAHMPTVLERPGELTPGPVGHPISPAADASARTMMVDSIEHHQQLMAAAAAVPPQGMAPPGMQRTVLLPNSEGVVSMQGGRGGGYPESGPVARYQQTPPPVNLHTRGASALFWLVCLLTGLAVGVGAYLIVLELGR